MKNDDIFGCSMVVVHWTLVILAGMLVWNFKEPRSFAGTIAFLILWALAAIAFHIIFYTVIALIKK